MGGAPAVPASLASRTVSPKNYSGMKIGSPRWGVESSSPVSLPPPRAANSYNKLRSRAMSSVGFSVNGTTYKNMTNIPGIGNVQPMMSGSAAQRAKNARSMGWTGTGGASKKAGLSMPTPSIGGPKGPLSMPSPSIGRPSGGALVPTSSPKSNSGFNRSFGHLSDAAIGIGIGAMAGGTASYATGGNFGQGAFMGGIAGGAGYGMMASKLGQKGVRGFSPKLAGMMSGTENVANRRMMMAGGGMLAGGMFGGNRSHRRGFNARRGNSIGR